MPGIPFDELKRSQCHECIGQDEKGDSLYCGRKAAILKPPRCEDHVSTTVPSEEEMKVRDQKRIRVNDQGLKSASYNRMS